MHGGHPLVRRAFAGGQGGRCGVASRCATTAAVRWLLRRRGAGPRRREPGAGPLPGPARIHGRRRRLLTGGPVAGPVPGPGWGCVPGPVRSPGTLRQHRTEPAGQRPGQGRRGAPTVPPGPGLLGPGWRGRRTRRPPGRFPGRFPGRRPGRFPGRHTVTVLTGRRARHRLGQGGDAAPTTSPGRPLRDVPARSRRVLGPLPLRGSRQRGGAWAVIRRSWWRGLARAPRAPGIHRIAAVMMNR